jgi:hypothetical protein
MGQTIGAPGSDFYPNGGVSSTRANVQATLTSSPPVAVPTKTKCKKKKHKRSAASAKKKKCKKHKKK